MRAANLCDVKKICKTHLGWTILIDPRQYLEKYASHKKIIPDQICFAPRGTQDAAMDFVASDIVVRNPLLQPFC